MRRTFLSSKNPFYLLKPKREKPISAAAFRHFCTEPQPFVSPGGLDTGTGVASVQTSKPDDPPSIIDPIRKIASLLRDTNPEDWPGNAELRNLLSGSSETCSSSLLKITRQLGSYQKSLQFFNYVKTNRVHDESSTTSVSPDPSALSFTFQGVLEHASCEEGRDVPTKLQELFVFARDQNVPLTVMSATLLMKHFGRAKMFEETVAVFNALDPALRNTFVVNLLLDSMLKAGRLDDALKLFDEMLESKLEFFPNRNTVDIVLPSVLTRNWSGRSLREKEIFELVLKFAQYDVFPNSVWLTQVVSKFCRQGKCDLAWDLVHEVMRLGGEVETVPCNALLTGLGKDHNFQRMNLLMNEMKEKKIQPDVVTFGILINNLCKMRRVDQALEVFKSMRGEKESGGISVEPDSVIYNTLIDGLCKVGRQEEGLELMEKMRSQDGCRPDTATYNCLMDGFCKAGEIDRAFELFNQMNSDGVEPNVITLNTLLNGMSKSGRVSTAIQFFDEMQGKGLRGDATSYTILITAFCSVNNIEKAMKFFDQMLQNGISPDATVYYSLISGLSQAGRMDDASFVVSKMRASGFCLDIISYNVLISGFCRKNKFDKAVELFEQMDESGVMPDRVTFNTLISYFGEKGHLGIVHRLMEKMLKDGIRPNIVTYGAMIHAHCEAGKLEEAMQIYKQMSSGPGPWGPGKSPNTIIYNTLINAHCKANKIEIALSLLDDMKDKGVRPNTSTFNSLLRALQENHWLEKAFELMDQMTNMACNPDYITMEILTEWLPAVGQTEKLQTFVKGYKVSPSIA
ncbi:hypothetical protein M9H77_33196 [Catharanthus roseus]|uniref:Uncharacterized protein n=1 Tax=Catharanthus roseus TaxID=4058 RepID=A0ACB9ZIY2_CATRO|nr:hypothetical protein M9H77_33196 [Catharanthus roseus]